MQKVINGNCLYVDGLKNKRKTTIPKTRLDARLGILSDIAQGSYDMSIRHTRASSTSSAIAYCNPAFLAATNGARSCGYQDVNFVWSMIWVTSNPRDRLSKGCLALGSPIAFLVLSWPLHFDFPSFHPLKSDNGVPDPAT
jgi:hypothetical protein